MKPADFGFPSKFTAFRPGQLEAAVDIASAETRFVMDSMPTGEGKSVIYTLAARLLGDGVRAMVLTSNLGLQAQLTADFSSMGLVDIRGQRNYPCELLKDKPGYKTCDHGPCHLGRECDLHPRHPNYRMGCSFYDQMKRIRQSRLCVTNYDFWMSVNRYMDPGILGRFDILIADEGHDSPDKLADFCQVEVHADECEEFLDSGLPPVEDGVDAWANWADSHRKELAMSVENMKADRTPDDDPDTIHRAQDLLNKLETIATARTWLPAEGSDPNIHMPGRGIDWVAERINEGGTALFSPVWAHAYAEPYLWANIPRVVMVSATLLKRAATYVGIDDATLTYREHTSGFHIDRRPVYALPTAQLNYHSSDSDYRAVVVKMDQIIGGRLDRKGIVQVPSYDLAYRLRQGSQHKGRILWHKRDKAGPQSLDAVITQFRSAPPGTVLMSPTISQGYDFPYDQCVIPSSKVLTSDLRWAQAGDVKVGDTLAGFDEEYPRRWQPATVISVNRLLKPCFKITLEDGTETTSSDDHHWLSRRAGKARWVRTRNISTGQSGDGTTRLIKLANVWGSLPPYVAGYLAAAFDGEGTYCPGHLGFYQKRNAMLAEVKEYLTASGFSYTERSPDAGFAPGLVNRLWIKGGTPEYLRFAAQVAPKRLNIGLTEQGMIMGTNLAVIHKEFVGIKEVIAIGTTTHTLIVDGVASHNCEYQIIAKMPFPPNQSAVMKARVRSDKQYLNYLTVLRLVQQCGRGMRAPDDQCETFILDSNFGWFKSAAKTLIPGWFRAAIRPVETIPQPPPRLVRRRLG